MPTSAEQKTEWKNLDSQAPRYLPLETVAIRLKGSAVGPGQPVFGILANISGTGCCVITNLPALVHVPVELELETARWPEKVEIPCFALWCAERMEPVKEIAGFVTGLRFEADARAAVRALLESGIFQLVPSPQCRGRTRDLSSAC